MSYQGYAKCIGQAAYPWGAQGRCLVVHMYA
jgi:hypothetical protein